MKTFFDRSLTGIRTLVSEQVKQVQLATGKPAKKIFLVGGLGSSPYVYSVLQSAFNGIVLRSRHPWSAVARGAVFRLLREHMATQIGLTPHQSEIFTRLPEVSSRRSRYSYGILVNKLRSGLSDYEEDLDTTEIDAAGEEVTPRMDWYLRTGEEVIKKKPVVFHYSLLRRGPLSSQCVLEIQYSSKDTPPKRADRDVSDLCRIRCDWDKPFEDWTPVGTAGWRRHSDLSLAMKFEGEPIWKVRVGFKEQEQNVNVEYS